jgi:methionine-S-sulfoxide reductase
MEDVMEKLILVVVVWIVVLAIGAGEASSQEDGADENDADTTVATFAGGCFWCMESAFEKVEGVTEVVSGYSGGEEENPTYKQVASGQTRHREAVQVHYDPAKVDYEELLDVFWRNIDPTQEGGQFADRGFQYTTAIFYHDEEQKAAAQASRRKIAEHFDEPIVTAIEPFTNFYRAEEYHQDYYRKNPVRYELYNVGSGRKGFIQEKWGEK